MMIPVISVACKQLKTKNTLSFLCPCMQVRSLRLQLADLNHDLQGSQEKGLQSRSATASLLIKKHQCMKEEIKLIV